MPEREDQIVIIGAGIAGLSTGLFLQRSGHQVAIIDPLGPGGGASYGNAGLISPDAVIPIALPGILRKVPKWLMQPLGPLYIKPAYLPKVTPWLLRKAAASRKSRVAEISDAMRALHQRTFACWQELLGEENFKSLITQTGQVRIWEPGDKLMTTVDDLYARHGIETKRLNHGDLREIYPSISPNIGRGLLLPNSGYTLNPQRLLTTLSELFLKSGGSILAEQVQKIIPKQNSGFLVLTNLTNRVAPKLVICAGAWSEQLLRPFGIKIPLESERGYHVMLPANDSAMAVPLTNQSRGFAMTPMENGIRIAGTVEFAGLNNPPYEERALGLKSLAKQLFPNLNCKDANLWMGHRPSTPDGLPIIGEIDALPGAYLLTGHGHFGLTGGPPSARLITNLINNQPNSIDMKPYSPNRFRARQ